MKCVILANDSNVNLWPISKESYPNFLLNLEYGKSIFNNVFEAALSLMAEKNILIAANKKLINELNFQIQDIFKKTMVIAEPLSKGTAPAAASALTYLQNKKDEVVLILPVGFLIKDVSSFKTAVEKAKNLVKKGYIVSFGLKSSSIIDESGYIQTGENIENCKKVDKFFEKNKEENTNELFKQKNIYLNSGIYLAKISTLVDIFLKQEYSRFSKKMFVNNNIKYEFYENISSCSIDYVLSKSIDKVVFVELESSNYDYISWQTLYKNSEKDSKQNVISGNVISDNVKNSFIYSQKELTAVSGIKNAIIVETGDAVLVCDNSRTKDISKLINKLEKNSDLTSITEKTKTFPWGFYTVQRSVKGWLSRVITVYPEQQLSLNINDSGFSHIVILEGSAVITLNEEKYTLKKRQSIDIPAKINHLIKNNSKNVLKIFEIQKES